MEKCFNIAGPCFPDEHSMLPALERLPGIMRIVEQRSYFVLHAARQSGKTTALMALGSKRLDLCVEFGKFRYAVELKMRRNFSPSESPAQLAGDLDTLGLSEGWMAVFDEDKTKPWDDKIYSRDVAVNGKTIHVVGL